MELQLDDLFSWERRGFGGGFDPLQFARKAQCRAAQPTEGTDTEHVQPRKVWEFFLSFLQL